MAENLRERMAQLWQMEAYTIKRLPEVINYDALEQVCQKMAEATKNGGRILATGKGLSGVAVRKLVNNLCSADIPAVYLSVGDGRQTTLGMLRSGDVLLLVSRGGSNEELLHLIEPAQEKGVFVVGITQNPASMLGMKADMLLRILVVKELDIKDPRGNAAAIATMGLMDALSEGTIMML